MARPILPPGSSGGDNISDVMFRLPEHRDQFRDPGRGRLPSLQQCIEDARIRRGRLSCKQGLPQDLPGVPESRECFAVEEGLMTDLRKSVFDRPEGAYQIPAVGCRNVPRSQRKKCLNIIPVEEMPFMALQTGNRPHRQRQLLDNFIHRDVPEIVRRGDAGKPETNVCRARPHRQSVLI